MSGHSHARRLSALIAVLLLVVAACGGDDAAEEPAAETEAAVAEPTTEVTEAPTTEATETATAAPTPAGDAATDMATEAPMTEAGSAAAAGEAAVAVASTDLGEVLVDAEGMTLYLFTPDEQSESTCYDQCAESWPPLTVDGEVTVGEQLDQTLFSTVARDDGAQQVTVNGWPLYYFAGDSAAGDVNGQGVNDVWFAVTPMGEAVES